MNNKEQITELIDSSFRFQKMIFYGMGVVAAIVGVGILILSVAVPPKPGEETVVQVLRIVSVIFILFGGWAYWYVNQRLNKVYTLLFKQPEKIGRIYPYQVQKRGVVAFAIRIDTKDKKMVGFNVVGPKTQKKLLELFAQELPDVEVVN